LYNTADSLPTADHIADHIKYTEFGTPFTWTGTLPPADYFEIDDGS
jgi:hypothetical protein